MRGSSMDRKEKRRSRARLNGALRGKVEGDSGSPAWEERLSVEPRWPDLPWPQEDGFWAAGPEATGLASPPSSEQARANGVEWNSTSFSHWDQPPLEGWASGMLLERWIHSDMEPERMNVALLPSAVLEESRS